MDQLISTVITGLPNLAVAVWCIYNYQVTIRGLLEQQNKLLDQLLLARGVKLEGASQEETH